MSPVLLIALGLLVLAVMTLLVLRLRPGNLQMREGAASTLAAAALETLLLDLLLLAPVAARAETTATNVGSPALNLLLIPIAAQIFRFRILPLVAAAAVSALAWTTYLLVASSDPDISRALFEAARTGDHAFFAALLPGIPLYTGILTLTLILALAVNHARRLAGKAADMASALSGTVNNAEHLAFHDALTNLANRRHLDLRLTEIGTQSDQDENIALLHLDLDRFKPVNDTLGHAAGDHVLVHVASVLRRFAHATDFVARIGGDEFVIIRQPAPELPELDSLAKRLIDEISKPILYKTHQCRISASVGFAVLPARQAGQLLINADLATYQAKQAGRCTASAYSAEFHQRFQQRSRETALLLEAFEKQQFEPHYQPQFDAVSGNLVGVEVLARWNHPEKGLLGPHFFLDLARELSLVSQLDQMMFHAALRDIGHLASAGIDVPRLNINLGFACLADTGLLTSVQGLAQPPAQLSFDLTETVFLESDVDEATWMITSLRHAGAEIVLDGFGSAHSSITALMSMRPDRVKIGRKLVMAVTHSVHTRELVRSLINIGKSLDIRVAAVGVESGQHRDILTADGCDVLQGFHLAKPMTATDLAAAFRAGGWVSAPSAIDPG